uniref:acetyl-CoA carboxylase subunit beta n=1 Tax=Dactylicapnos grandifoliolata TaxID=1549782 RepID=UPI0030FE9999
MKKKKRWFNSRLFNGGLEHRCGLSKSMDNSWGYSDGASSDIEDSSDFAIEKLRRPEVSSISNGSENYSDVGSHGLNNSGIQSSTSTNGSDYSEDSIDSSDPCRKYRDLWVQCENEKCIGLNYKKFLKERLNICEHCGEHLKMSSSERIELSIDPGTWDPMDEDMALDPVIFGFLSDSWEQFEWLFKLFEEGLEELIKLLEELFEELSEELSEERLELRELVFEALELEEEEALVGEAWSELAFSALNKWWFELVVFALTEPEELEPDELLEKRLRIRKAFQEELEKAFQEQLEKGFDKAFQEELEKAFQEEFDKGFDKAFQEELEKAFQEEFDKGFDKAEQLDKGLTKAFQEQLEKGFDKAFQEELEKGKGFDKAFQEELEKAFQEEFDKAFQEEFDERLEKELEELERDEELEALFKLFEEEPSYEDYLHSYQMETGLAEAVETGIGEIYGIPVAFGVMDFRFIGGSMGSVVGEKITRLIEYATNECLPVIIVCASGGARMQEGSLSLIQMAKISSALYQYHYQLKEDSFYISILTSPTTGGVTASFGMLGDIIIAEPHAYIAFAGKRVIEETLKIEVPEGVQVAEYLFEKGLLDLIVERKDLKDVLSELFEFHADFPFNQDSIN